MTPGDSIAIHCSHDGATWYDEPLARDASTGFYAPSAPMSAGEYEGLLHIKSAGGSGGDLWLPIFLAGLRDGRSGGANNRCWTILFPAV